MRKILLSLLFGIGVLALAFYVFYNNREKRFPEANISMLNNAETQWYNAGITDYRVVVEVEFSTERRRHTMTIRNGQVAEATLSYWQRAWSEPETMGLDQAALYTIPGLFTTLRQELNLNFREDVRVDMNADPRYPRYIYLGQVWQGGEPMNESEARFTVTEFEILTAP